MRKPTGFLDFVAIAPSVVAVVAVVDVVVFGVDGIAWTFRFSILRFCFDLRF